MTVHRTRLHRTRPRPGARLRALAARQRARLGSAAEMLRGRLAEERGDVPGWVFITLMTAGIPVVTLSG